MERDRLRNELLSLFYDANKLMFERDYENVINDVSERSICASLKEAFSDIMKYFSFFDQYYADVEYNRGKGKAIKSYQFEGEEPVSMTCDLIIHSRGSIADLDNLICIEMKKINNTWKNEDDRKRLKALTTPGGCKSLKKKLIVRDYVLGIFYTIDLKNERILLELYKNGSKFDDVLISFDDIFQSKFRYFLFTRTSKRDITFYNVGFGDSFLIRENKNGLLVDCGSKNIGSRKTIMVSKISNDLKSLKNDLLLTHYHLDHYSLLKDICSNGVYFEKVYVRNLDAKTLHFTLLNVLTELVKYVKASGDYNSLFGWLNPNVNVILNHCNYVVGVNSDFNHTIWLGSTVANVLWPSSTASNDLDTIAEIDNIIEEVESLLKGANDSVVAFLNKCFLSYKKLFRVLRDREGMVSIEEIRALLGKDTYEEVPSTEQVKAFVDNLDIPDNLSKRIRDMENHLSIVFEIESKLLMCGDADDSAMKCAIAKYKFDNDLKDKDEPIFDILKVPHHGTEDYFLEKCWNKYRTNLLIPNSEEYNGWLIHDRYTFPNSVRCFSLNNCCNSACQSALSSKCRLGLLGTVDYKVFKF